MKRIVLTILIATFLIGLSTGCGKRIVVNEKVSGRSDHWAVTYEIKGRVYTRIDRNGNEKINSFGRYTATFEYVGDLTDINNLTQWGMKAIPLFNFANGRNCPPDEAPFSTRRGGVTPDMLLVFHNDEIPTIMVTWNGDVSGEEAIALK